MLYECTCGYEASTATAFYRHLSTSNKTDAGATHQLVQGKPRAKAGSSSPSQTAKTKPGTEPLTRKSAATGPVGASAGTGLGGNRSQWQGLGMTTTTTNPLAGRQSDGIPDYLLDPETNQPITDVTASQPSTSTRGTGSSASLASMPLGQRISRQRSGSGTLDPLDRPLSAYAPSSTTAARPIVSTSEFAVGPGLRQRSSTTAPPQAAAGSGRPSSKSPAAGAGGGIGRGRIVSEQEIEVDLDQADALRSKTSPPAGLTGWPRPPALQSPGTGAAGVLSSGPWSGGGGGGAGGQLTPGAAAAGVGMLFRLVGSVGLAPLRAMWSAAAATAPHSTDMAAGEQPASPTNGHRSPQEITQARASGGGALPAPSFFSAPGPSGATSSIHTALTSSAPHPTLIRRAVADAESLLLWEQPWQSGQVLVGGLYGILCTTQLTRGSSLLATSTAVLGLAFLTLLFNIIRMTVWNIRRHRSQPHSASTSIHDTATVRSSRDSAAGVSGQDTGHNVWEAGGPGTPHGVCPSPTMQRAMDEEARVYATVYVVLARCALIVVPLVAGAVALSYRALSGRRLASSVLTAGCLWLGMLLGEVRIVSQPLFAALCWLGVFTIPCAYVRSRAVADHVVEDLLRCVVRLMVQSERGVLLAALGVAGGCLAWLPLTSWVLRATAALVSSLSVLLYAQYHSHNQSHSQSQSGATTGSEGNGAVGQGGSPPGSAVAGHYPPLPMSVTAAAN